MILHPFDPAWDIYSRVLILGSFPSKISRDSGFYYAHPRNRFWMVLANIFHDTVPDGITQKRSFLQDHQIALWDVLKSCDISGSSDSSIHNAVSNDLATLLDRSSIERVLLNGGKAYSLYKRFFDIALPTLVLPSTSPANASWSLERLTEAWRKALE